MTAGERRSTFLELLKAGESRTNALRQADIEGRVLRVLTDPLSQGYDHLFASTYFGILADTELEMEDVVYRAAKSQARSSPQSAAKYRNWIQEDRERWESRLLLSAGETSEGSSIADAKRSDGGFGDLRAV